MKNDEKIITIHIQTTFLCFAIQIILLGLASIIIFYTYDIYTSSFNIYIRITV